MIEFEQVSIRYADAPAHVVRGVNLHVEEGELCLVVGRTGARSSCGGVAHALDVAARLFRALARYWSNRKSDSSCSPV